MTKKRNNVFNPWIFFLCGLKFAFLTYLNQFIFELPEMVPGINIVRNRLI